jgi:hypothetical protein
VCDGGKIATMRGFEAEPEREITYHPIVVYSYAREHAKLDKGAHANCKIWRCVAGARLQALIRMQLAGKKRISFKTPIHLKTRHARRRELRHDGPAAADYECARTSARVAEDSAGRGLRL